MLTNEPVFTTVERFARLKGAALAPNWSAELEPLDPTDLQSLERMAAMLGWPEPLALVDRPRPDQFPLLVWSPEQGLMIATQWRREDVLQLHGGQVTELPWTSTLVFFDVMFPDPLQGNRPIHAIDIFRRAIKRRKSVLLAAALATIVANILTLATSLYSMQLFDRVIPLGSFSTLWVLTVGVLIALAIDWALRSTRALLIEREAGNIDAEVSEYFFARAQSVRLDERPPGVGTMAAQLRGLEQVRSLMSSASIFVMADLPFALFFVVVVFWLGGVVALVPIIALPLALSIAFLIGRSMRIATERAQVSAMRKNGMLVESLDAVETIKATRGGWFMLARWNRLVHEIHHHEDPIKRTSAITTTVFSTLQQIAYVCLMAVGAVEVSQGRLTAGGLLACSIIGGRINGPLLAMLPNLIVQWGYARSSLKSLDAIIALPVDTSTEKGALRPATLVGPLLLENVHFAYPGAREGLDIERLEIRAGERVAIIGGIGSGKSTLLRLMAGLYPPQQGLVRLAGLDVAQIADDIVRDHVGYLPQDYRLVHGSLRENLTMGLPNVSDTELLDVAKVTGLAAMIAAHPKGLDISISEGGRGLSGGQRGLVGMTRLVLSKPRLWLLDEPTANFDQATEGMAMSAVARQLGPRDTLVLVTHRMHLLAGVERVIVLAQGKIVMDGPADEVITRLKPKRPAPQVIKTSARAE